MRVDGMKTVSISKISAKSLALSALIALETLKLSSWNYIEFDKGRKNVIDLIQVKNINY